MNHIAIIPARGGSKRIPRKNVKNFLGVPAIGLTIDTLIKSEIFSQIIVTTDDSEISQISLEYGASHIVARPDYLSTDFAITVPTVLHALETWAHETSRSISHEDIVCCVYPVNPFLAIGDLSDGIETLKLNPDISYVNPVCTYPYPIERALILDSNSRIKMLNLDKLEVRSQDTLESFHDAGQWYLGTARSWQNMKPLLENSIGIAVPRWRVQDIDSEEDWLHAEMLKLVQLKKSTQ